VPVQDRTDDGVVDDLGPAELRGTWGASSVIGELRTPIRTAFSR